jgi:hypothetical protein
MFLNIHFYYWIWILLDLSWNICSYIEIYRIVWPYTLLPQNVKSCYVTINSDLFVMCLMMHIYRLSAHLVIGELTVYCEESYLSSAVISIKDKNILAQRRKNYITEVVTLTLWKLSCHVMGEKHKNFMKCSLSYWVASLCMDPLISTCIDWLMSKIHHGAFVGMIFGEWFNPVPSGAGLFNLWLMDKMLPMTVLCCLWKKSETRKCLLSIPWQNWDNIEVVLKTYELIYGDIHYITNVFCKNVLKLATP